MSPRTLLNRLLDRCIDGHCSRQTAATVLGIEPDAVSELMAGRLAMKQALRVFSSALNQAFPECNAKLARRIQPPPFHMNLFKPTPPGPCQTFYGEEARRRVCNSTRPSP